MSDLTDLLHARDEAYEKQTSAFFKQIHTIIAATETFINSNDPLIAAGSISWEDVNIVEDNLIHLIGIVEYVPGITLHIDGQHLLLTQDNIEYFTRVIHFTLPLTLVEAANPQQILEYLEKIKAERNDREGSAEEQEPILNQSPIIQSTTTQDTKVLTPAEPDRCNFDLDALSEEQLRTLSMNRNLFGNG